MYSSEEQGGRVVVPRGGLSLTGGAELQDRGGIARAGGLASKVQKFAGGNGPGPPLQGREERYTGER